MNSFITKYKNVDMQLQTSRKHVRKYYIFYIILICIILCMNIWLWAGDAEPFYTIFISLLIFLIAFGADLYYIDWTIKIENNTLLVRRWILNYQIPFKDLIYIECLPNSRSYLYGDCLEIAYKKENRIKYLNFDYLRKGLFRYEFINQNEIIKFINIFYREGVVISDFKEKDILLSEYIDIRTDEEEKEMDDLINKTRRREEKGIWIVLCILIAMFITFLWFIFRIN